MTFEISGEYNDYIKIWNNNKDLIYKGSVFALIELDKNTLLINIGEKYKLFMLDKNIVGISSSKYLIIKGDEFENLCNNTYIDLAAIKIDQVNIDDLLNLYFANIDDVEIYSDSDLTIKDLRSYTLCYPSNIESNNLYLIEGDNEINLKYDYNSLNAYFPIDRII